MYVYIVLSCFLGAVLYYSNEYANMKQYHEGPKDMGKLLNSKTNITMMALPHFIENKFIVTSAMYEEHCSKDVRSFTYTSYTEEVLQALLKFIPRPSQLDKSWAATCWYSNIDLSPLMEHWKSRNELLELSKWNFQFDSDKQAESVYDRILADKQKKRLICIPNIYFGGPPKCGSTQLYDLLVTHPLLQGSLVKEPNWWAKGIHYIVEKDAHPYKELSVLGFLAQFSELTECASKSPSCLGIDASTSLFTDDISHYGICELPHLFREIIPNAKFIVILRNPTSRLYSEYWFNLPEQVKNIDLSGPKVFHELVEKQIQHFNECMREYNNGMVCIEQQVAFDWQNTTISLHHIIYGLYYINIRKWLAVFPKENFIFVRSEDLHDNPREVIGSIWKFLGLPVHFTNIFDAISRKEALHQAYPPILPETKKIVDNFYREYNMKLSELLNDDRYMWRDH